jgi:hypothetical protein
MNINRKDSFTTTTWSGGTTTELRIMPEDALYSERKFDFRVSTATVEPGESKFTPLPGVDRHLMVLSGKILLKHMGHQEILLDAFDQNHFDGGITTVSFSEGPVVDFNLMLKSPFKGRLNYYPCESELLIEGQPSPGQCETRYRDFYCVNGPVEMAVGNRSLRLFSGDYLQLQQTEIANEVAVMGCGNIVEISVWSE